ncbi:hypothetical protein ACLOJK_033844 [Asimina triloba]
MDPFGEIIRVCVVSTSQEEVLRRSRFPGESIDPLPTPSASQKDEAFGGHIPEFPVGIVISTPHQRSSDEEEDGQEQEEDGIREESPCRVRLQETLEKTPLQTPAGSTLEEKPPEKCPPDIRRMSPEKSLNRGILDEDAGGGEDGAGEVRSPGRKRKSTVEMELRCSPGSPAKKARFVISESRDLSLQKLKRDTFSGGGSAPPLAENVKVSVELGLSKGKSAAEKDKGFFERLKARLFSRNSLGLSSPERPKVESSTMLRITAGINTENARRSPASEEKISPAVKGERSLEWKGFSPEKSSVSELRQGVGKAGESDAAVSEEKDRGLWELKEESCRRSLASKLNVWGVDAAVSEGISPEQAYAGLPKSKEKDLRMSLASELLERITEIRDVDTIVSKESPLEKVDLLLSKSKGESSIQFAAQDSEKSQKSTTVTIPIVLPGDGESPSPKPNASAQEAKSQADDNIRFSKSPRKIPNEFLAKDQHSKSAGGIPNVLHDPTAQQVNKEQVLENPPSDLDHDAGRNPSSNDTGLAVDVFPNTRNNHSSDAQKCSSKEFIKEASGMSKSNSKDVCMRQKRKLPPSIQGPSDENRGHFERGGDPLSKSKGFDNAHAHLLGMAKALSKESKHVIEQESFLEVAKQAGYVFPRPRWWRSEGYSK